MDLFDVAAKLTIDTSSYTSGLDQAGGSTESFQSRLQRLQTEYNKAAAEVKVLQKALNEYVQETGNAEHAGEELAAMLADKQIEAAGAKAAIGELVDAEKNLGEEEEESGEKGEEAGNKVKKAGDNAEDAGKKTKKLVSALKTGAQAFSAIAAAAAAAVAAVGKTINDVAEYGDNVDKMSQKLGMSAKSYQEWDAVMQHAGTSIDSMQAGMKTLASAAEQGNDAFAKLGLSQSDIASMSQEELFSATITALQNVEDETQRTYLAGKLLGRGATELGPLLNMSAEETQQLKARVNELGGVMSDEAVKASATFKDNLQDLTTAFQGLKRGMVQQFLPGANMVLAGFTSLIIGEEGAEEKIDEGLKNVLSTIENVLPQLADKVMSLGESLISSLPNILNIGLEIIQSLVNGIVSNAGMIGGAVSDIVVLIIEKIGSLLPSIVTGALQLVGQLATSLGQALPTLIPEIVGIVVAMAEALTNPDSLMAVINGALELVKGLAEGIVKALPLLIEAVPVIIQNLVDFIVQAIPQIMEAGTQILLMLVQGVLNALPSLLAAIPTVIASIVQGIMKLFPQIIMTGAQMMFQLALGLWQAVPGLIQQMPMIINSMVDAIVGNATTFAESGIQLIMQLINGIITAVPILVEQIPQIVSAIGAAIVEAAPQIVQAGKKLISGLWDGIKGAFSGKKGDVDVASGFDFGSVQTQAQATATSVSSAFSGMNTTLDFSAATTSATTQFSTLGTSATTAKDEVVTAFTAMGTEAATAMSTAASGSGADWSSITRGAQSAAKQAAASFKSLPNQFRAIWQQIKTIYNEVPSFFTRVFTVAKQNVLAAWSGVPAQFSAIWQQIKLVFDKPETYSQWGSDMVQNFINGINLKKSELYTLLNEMAGKIKAVLGHSHPTEGPMKDDYMWMPDMMNLFIGGIKQYTPKLHKTVLEAFDFSDMMQYPAEDYTFSSSGNLAKHTVSVRNSTDAKIDTLINLLRAYLPQLGNQQIVLDDGTLVGAMLPQIDAELGQSYLYKLRGNA